MHGAFTIEKFSVVMRKMTEIIGRTYRNSSNLKRCMDGTKEIALPKTKPEIGDDGVTSLQDLVDAKIFKYQIREYFK